MLPPVPRTQIRHRRPQNTLDRGTKNSHCPDSRRCREVSEVLAGGENELDGLGAVPGLVVVLRKAGLALQQKLGVKQSTSLGGAMIVLVVLHLVPVRISTRIGRHQQRRKKAN